MVQVTAQVANIFRFTRGARAGDSGRGHLVVSPQ